MEATYPSIYDPETYVYGYVTYDKIRLNGPRINNTKNYNVQAQGKVPISQKEFVYMRLYTDKSDQIYDFSMTYCRYLNSHGDAQIEKKFHNGTMLNVRADYGHGRSYPHMDIEVFAGEKKIVSQDVEQDHEFPNYLNAINAVFMQIERISNPLVGAQYWLSPLEIFPERVAKLARLKGQHEIATSLGVISCAINVRLYEETRAGIIIDDEHFWKIAESQMQLVKEKEKELGGSVDIVQINYSTQMSVLPFLFFAPEEATYAFKVYRSDGSEILTKGDNLGVVWEKKNGIAIVRDLDHVERSPASMAS